MKALVAILLVICLPVAAWANRVALVIGNSQYTSVASLDNPQNDSTAVAQALRAQGFEVLRGDNLGRVEFRDTLRRFRALADRSEIALVYYAGHGIEIGGINYLVPVDARLEDERDADLEMVEVDLVLRQISGARTLKMVVLDACRNNPFVAKMQRQGGSRSVSQGLGDIRSTEADTLISYAAAAGEITPDGFAGENSPFTAAFLIALAGPPTDVRRMLGRVRDQMRLTVPGAAPFVYSSLGGSEYIINPRSAGSVPNSNPTPPATDSAGAGGASISLDFVRIDRSGDVADWDEFLVRYEAQSDHPLYAFALEKRSSLQGRALTLVTPAPSTAPAADGEVRSGAQTTQKKTVTPVIAPVLTADEVGRSLQKALKQRGCYAGSIDGILGRNSKRGLAEFARQAGVPITLPRGPDADQLGAILDIVRAFPDASCPRVATVRPSTSKPATTQAAPRKKPATSSTTTTKSTKQSESGSSGYYTRRDSTKFVPRSAADCIGPRAKFYDCG